MTSDQLVKSGRNANCEAVDRPLVEWLSRSVDSGVIFCSIVFCVGPVDCGVPMMPTRAVV